MIKKCLVCDKEFKTKPSRVKKGYGKFCSRRCWFSSKRKFIKCSYCNKSFSVALSRKRKFCSHGCYSKSRVGSSVPLEIRKKMGEGKMGIKHYNWKNGRARHTRGYILILQPSHPACNKRGYILKHRLVAEECLGGYLTKEEVIHHINGILDDNSPENLYLFTSSIEHSRYERLKNKLNKLKSNLYIWANKIVMVWPAANVVAASISSVNVIVKAEPSTV